VPDWLDDAYETLSGRVGEKLPKDDIRWVQALEVSIVASDSIGAPGFPKQALEPGPENGWNFIQSLRGGRAGYDRFGLRRDRSWDRFPAEKTPGDPYPPLSTLSAEFGIWALANNPVKVYSEKPDDRINYVPVPPNPPQGPMGPSRRVRIWLFRFFLNADVGQPETVRDPFTGFDEGDLPGPIVLSDAKVDADAPPDQRDDYVRVLGVAAQAHGGDLLKGRFSGGRPADHQLAIAQAYVFNNHSWDLWTQMWQAQLEPIKDLDRWERLMTAQGGLPGSLPEGAGPSSELYQAVLEHLRAIEPLAEHRLTH
jgi:hypothetical protein